MANTVRYLNVKRSYGVENIDHLDRKDFADANEFRKEQQHMQREYALMGSYYAGSYWSSRKGNA